MRTDARNVVITGSARGLGAALADAFLALGCGVGVSGRTQGGVDSALELLRARYPRARLAGHACDVTRYDEVVGLFDAAVQALGNVDVWVNNAGAGMPAVPYREADPRAFEHVVQTNLLGTLYGAQVALRGMTEARGGQVFNMEGFGSQSWMKRSGMAVYGSTKCAVRYLSDSLAREAKGGPVDVCTLMPGVVLTEMLSEQHRGMPERERRPLTRLHELIGEPPERVAPWLARKVLSHPRNGAHINWLTPTRFVWTFLRRRFIRVSAGRRAGTGH